MDRSTKERLTGAIVLVAVAWLVIPVFLDGPGEEGETVRQRVELPGRDTAQTQTKTIVLKPDTASGTDAPRVTDPPPVTRRLSAPARDEPGPEAKVEAEPRQEPAVQPPAPAQETPPPQPAAKAAESGPAPSGSVDTSAAVSLWAVQLGSFSNQANAEGLAADLRKQGFAAFLSRVDAGGKSLHRVRVGPQGSRAEAEKVAARLKSAGHDGQVVSHP